jgi:hypothetical protein
VLFLWRKKLYHRLLLVFSRGGGGGFSLVIKKNVAVRGSTRGRLHLVVCIIIFFLLVATRDNALQLFGCLAKLHVRSRQGSICSVPGLFGRIDIRLGRVQTDRQTISFIEISIEAGILLGGKHEACFVLGVAGIEPMQS